MFPKIMGTPKSSILIGFSIIFTIHFGGKPTIFGNTHMLGVGILEPNFAKLQVVSLLPIIVRPCGRNDARGRGRPGTSSSGRGAQGP